MKRNIEGGNMLNDENRCSDYSRCLKEAGIEYHEMEKYKWNISKEKGYNIGREAFVKWANQYGNTLKRWLKKLSDEEIDRRYNQLPERIKEKVNKKFRSTIKT